MRGDARRSWTHAVALALIAAGAIGVALAVLPYKTFDLDRFFVPKELVLHGADALLSCLVLAVVLVGVTALLQAYGLETDYVSLNRAPGGTLGNRNFVAHLA